MWFNPPGEDRAANHFPLPSGKESPVVVQGVLILVGTNYLRKLDFWRLLSAYRSPVQVDKQGNITGNLSPPGFQMDYTYRGSGVSSARSLERVAVTEAARFPGQPFGGPGGTLERIWAAEYYANLRGSIDAIRPSESPDWYLLHWRSEAPAAHLNDSCAVRLSYAISQVDPKFFNAGVRGATWQQPISIRNPNTRRQERVRHPPRLPINARQLANDLDRIIGKRTQFSGRMPRSSGIIFFNKLWNYSGSGHISLWDGSRNTVVDLDNETAKDFFTRAVRVEFWQLWPPKRR